jgi:hypothetical protein
MRDILNDLVRQTKDLFEIVKVTGTAKETKIEAVDKDKMLFLQAALTNPQADLQGEFGISNLALLEGLLNFPSYRTDDAKFTVRRETKPVAGASTETVTAFEFKDANGKGAIYKTMSANLVANQAQIANIPWTLAFVPAKSKIAEFAQLFKVLAEVDKTFKVTTEDGDLVFGIGDSSTSTHSASIVFESGVSGELKTELVFDISQFLALMRIAGSHTMTLSITSKGVLGVVIQAPTGTYNYFLRAKR